MTLILDNLKRCEGEPLDDGTAPKTTVASQAIITQQATVLTAAKSVVCGAKTWLNDGYVFPTPAKHFNASIVDFSTLESIYNYIDTTRHHTNRYLIRYDLIDPTNTQHIRRLSIDKPDAPATLHDTPKHWVMFDIDTVKTPYDVTKDPVKAIEWFIENKAPMLKGVGMVWQLSSSRGHKKNDVYDLSVHFFVLLKTARTGANVKAWCERDAKGVFDLNMFDKPQPHFTADPIITKDYHAKDLCILRDGLIGGGALDMPLVIETVKEVKHKKQYTTPQQKQIAALTAKGSYRTPENRQDALRHLTNACNKVRKAGHGNRRMSVFANGFHLYGYVDAGILTDAEITDALFSAGQSTGLTAQQIDEKLDEARLKHKPYTPPDSYCDDFVELDPSDPRPVHTTKTAFFNIITQNDDDDLKIPRNVDDCFEAITATDNPIHSVKLFVWCLWVAAQGNPYKYNLNSVVERLIVVCGDKVHPSTIKAATVWALEVVALVKSRALESITISERYKKKHIHTKTDDLASIVYSPLARVQVLKAAMGVGKTKDYGAKISEDCAKNGKTFLAIAHLSSLVSELSNVLKTANYKDFGFCDDPTVTSLSCVINSIVNPVFTPLVNDLDVLFIDEGVQGIRALVAIYNEQTSVYGSYKGIYNPNDVYTLLVYAIRKAKRVVIADACANDELMDWLESILDGECIEIIEHEAKSGTGINVNYNYGANRDCAVSEGIAELKAELQQGRKLWISVESTKTGKLLNNVLSPLAKVFYLHKKTPSKLKTQFLSDVENESLKYDVVIVSPVIKSGISVTHKGREHFNSIYYIGDGSTCSPMDTLQMIRRVRYVKDVNVFTWTNFLRVGDSTRGKTPTDFYTLKNKLQNAIIWERHNFNASLFYCLNESGFNTKIRHVKGDIKETRALVQSVLDMTINELNNAVALDADTYKQYSFDPDKDGDTWDALDAYELREHLGIGGGVITDDDFRLWQDGRCRETLARRAACRGVALHGVEHSPVLVDIIQQLFKGVDALTLDVLDRATAQKIVDNALHVGKVGFTYGLLPASFRRKSVVITSPTKTARNILERCLSVTLSSFLLEQNDESVTIKRKQQRIYKVNHERGNELDAIIERLSTAKRPITTPLKDTIKERIFKNGFDLEQEQDITQDVNDVPCVETFDELPLFAQNVEQLPMKNDQINDEVVNVVKIPTVKTTCQTCTNLSTIGTCRLNNTQKRLDSRAVECNDFEVIFHKRPLVSKCDKRQTIAILQKRGVKFIDHAYNCVECDFDNRLFCMDGNKQGQIVVDCLTELNDPQRKERFVSLLSLCKATQTTATHYLENLKELKTA